MFVRDSVTGAFYWTPEPDVTGNFVVRFSANRDIPASSNPGVPVIVALRGEGP